MNRWGRVTRPRDDSDSYILLLPETREEGFPAAPGGSVRMWHRRQGAADDDEDNWTVWLEADQVHQWIGATGYYDVAWLIEGSEPEW